MAVVRVHVHIGVSDDRGNERNIQHKKCRILFIMTERDEKKHMRLLHMLPHTPSNFVCPLLLVNFCQITINKTAVAAAAVVIIVLFLPKICFALLFCHFCYGIHVVHALVY